MLILSCNSQFIIQFLTFIYRILNVIVTFALGN